jgi:hypothetical protein
LYDSNQATAGDADGSDWSLSRLHIVRGVLMFSALFSFVHLYIRKKGLSLESESA